MKFEVGTGTEGVVCDENENGCDEDEERMHISSQRAKQSNTIPETLKNHVDLSPW